MKKEVKRFFEYVKDKNVLREEPVFSPYIPSNGNATIHFTCSCGASKTIPIITAVRGRLSLTVGPGLTEYTFICSVCGNEFKLGLS